MAVEGHPGFTGKESCRFTHLPQRQLCLLDIECLVLFNQLFPRDSELFGRVIDPPADPAASAFPPPALISLARAFTASRLRAVTYSFAPCWAKDRATAPAISPDAANTTATLSFRCSILVVFHL
jgi:hypothetical protein